MKIYLENPKQLKPCPTPSQLKKWLDATLQTVANELPQTIECITIGIVDSTQSANLNLTYRNKKGPTNILSFVEEHIPGFETRSLGDLIVCAELVEKEAKEQDKEIFDHWAHLIIHGVLHLLGYDHIKPEDAAIMEPLEIKALNALGIDNPYT